MKIHYKQLILILIFTNAHPANAMKLPACLTGIRAAIAARIAQWLPGGFRSRLGGVTARAAAFPEGTAPMQQSVRRQHRDPITTLVPPEGLWPEGSSFARVRDEEHSHGMSGSRFYRFDRTLTHPDFGEIEIVWDDSSDAISHFSAVLISLKPRTDELPEEYQQRQSAFMGLIAADYPILMSGIKRKPPMSSERFMYRFPEDAGGGESHDLEVPRSWSRENRQVLKLPSSQSGILFDFNETGFAKNESGVLHNEFFARLILSRAVREAELAQLLSEHFGNRPDQARTHEFLVRSIGKAWVDMARAFDHPDFGAGNYSAVLSFVAGLDPQYVNPFINAMRDSRVRAGFYMVRAFSASTFRDAMETQLGIPKP